MKTNCSDLMAKFTSSTLLAVFAIFFGTARGDGCYYLSQVPGGCPDINKCRDVCTPCYRGIGLIVVECVPPTATALPYWECRCNFTKGAPCPPPVPPMCPKPPQPNHGPGPGPRPRPSPFQGNWLILNETHGVFHPKGIEPYGLEYRTTG